VGIGLKPPVFLKGGDVVEVEVQGLGVLKNTVTAGPSAPVVQEIPTPPGKGLTRLPNGKWVHVEIHGDPNATDTVVFVHGLGGSTSFYHSLLPLLPTNRRLVLYDLEGHGRTPTTAESVVSVASYADDLAALVSILGASGPVSVVGHSMGCHVALYYASQHDIKNLILLGPPAMPLPVAGAEGALKRAYATRESGMVPIADQVSSAAVAPGCSPLARAFVKAMLLSNDAEGYAKGCQALAGSSELELPKTLNVSGRKILVAGDEDKVASVVVVEGTAKAIGAGVVVLKNVGHWMAQEDVEGAAKAVADNI
jgi:pimeloyl-ACP methyl ester carboxylesterase